MAEHGGGSQPQNNDARPDISTRLSNAFRVDDRDWNTVSRRVATRMLAIGGALLAVFAGGIVGFRATYANKIYPNIHIGDVNVGGMTAEQAIAAVQKRVDELDGSTITYTLDQHTWQPKLSDLGIGVDIPSVVSRAMDLGRDEKAADRFMYTSTLAQGVQVVPLQFDMQPWKLEAWLDQVDTDIADPAIDATFTVAGASLDITQDYTGIGAAREAVTERVFESLRTFEPIAEDLPTDTLYPRITRADLEANEEEVLAILSNSVTIRFEDTRWEILPEEVSAYMIFTSDVENGRAVTSVDFERTELTRYLRERFAPEVNRLPISSQVQFYGGELTATTSAQDGKALKANEFADLVAASFLGNHERVDVPVVTTQAKVREDNISELGIKERLVRADSNFTSDLGTERAHNVQVGIQLLNNTVVAPGDDFSFNGAIGSIDANADFQTGRGIVAGVIQDEFGGGICQVTTTMFRAAIYGGFAITEWHPHTYRLSGYERDGWSAGFDASILQPSWQPADKWADFKFTNNTENYILVSSWSDNGIHVVEIYGTNPGWNVQVSEVTTWEAEPSDDNAWNVDESLAWGSNFISAWPIDGLNASFNRTVYDSNGVEMYTRDFTSPYQARGFQCTCSPDMVDVPCW